MRLFLSLCEVAIIRLVIKAESATREGSVAPPADKEGQAPSKHQQFTPVCCGTWCPQHRQSTAQSTSNQIQGFKLRGNAALLLLCGRRNWILLWAVCSLP